MAALCLASGVWAQGRQVKVTIDRRAPVGISRFDTGVTHEHYSLDAWGDPAAIARAKRLLMASCRYQCQAIMGWGADNPEPSPGIFDWKSLDARIALIRSLPGTVPVITLCAAPDWMKGGKPGQTDWSKIEVAPLPSHYADFAQLAAAVARRYPNVRHYQVWNEFKGFWDEAANNWDYAGYTSLYNQVNAALKAVDPRIQVGGPYLVVEGDGTDRSQWWGVRPITERNNRVIDYWLQHARGADFIVLDRSVVDDEHGRKDRTARAVMAQTSEIGAICDQVRAKTRLPIWFAECYGWTDRVGDRQLLAACMASLFAQLIRHGAATALVWQPQDDTPADWTHALFTDTRHSGGGQPYPLYYVIKALHQYFGPGVRLYQTTSSTPQVEALASTRKTLLINKSTEAVTVLINGRRFPLRGYQVLLIDTPE